MRKFIKICGVGERRQGTSKNNKPYDFTPISFCYEKPGVNGYVACTCNVSQDCIGTYVPTVNDEVEVALHEDFRSGGVFIDAFI